MKTINKILFLFIIAIMFTSCSRNSDDNATNNPSATTSGFTWRENHPTDAPLKTAGSSEVRTQYKSIFAFQGTTSSSGTLFEINLTGVSPGTYNLASSGNALFFSGFGTASSGEVIITKNDGSKASGTFKGFVTGTGAVTRVYGTFTDIDVK